MNGIQAAPAKPDVLNMEGLDFKQFFVLNIDILLKSKNEGYIFSLKIIAKFRSKSDILNSSSLQPIFLQANSNIRRSNTSNFLSSF